MRYLDASALRAALPMEDCIEAMEAAFGGDVEIPQRVGLGVSLFMVGRVGDRTGVKVVSTVPGDPAGLVAVFGADGAPLGLVDGPTLTALRTAAGAGLATRLLAREDATVLAMLGAGAMALDQVRAVQTVRPISRVVVWSRTVDSAKRLAERAAAEVETDPDQAVAQADIVTTATPATEPLFHDDAVGDGTHINAIGAFTRRMIEIPIETTRRARVFVDQRQTALQEAGDLLQADREPDGEIGELLRGALESRSSADEVTMFKSVGIASQDVAAAARALQNAERLDVGRRL